MAATLAAIGTAAAVAGEAAAVAAPAAGAAAAIPAAAGIGAGALGAGAAGLGTGLGVGAEALVAPPVIPAGIASSLAGAGPASASPAWAGLNPGVAQNLAGAGIEAPPVAAPGGGFGLKEMASNDMLMQMIQGIMKSAKGPAAPPVPDMPGGGASAAPPQTAAMQALARFKPFPKLSIGGGGGGGGGGDPMTALLMRLLRG